MVGLVALTYFAFGAGGVALAVGGTSAVLATRRLEDRMSRLIAPTPAAAVSAPWLTGLMKARGRDRLEIEEKLQQAGFQDEQAMQKFLLLRLVSTIAVVLLSMLASRMMTGSFLGHPVASAILGGLTYLASKRALLLFASARLRTITAEFPFLLDLMLMMLESGISLDQCFRAVARDESNAAPQLTRSIEALVVDLDRGMSYEGALDRWAARLRVVGAQELSSLFQQSLFQGIELSPALREFVREFTDRRVASAREAMGRAGVQMTVVMMLFFMPALFIVIGAPPLAGLLDTLGSISK